MNFETATLTTPCVGCRVCVPGGMTDTDGNVLHLGNFPINPDGSPMQLPPHVIPLFPKNPAWKINGDMEVVTHRGLKLTLRIALPDDVALLLRSPSVFPESDENGKGVWAEQLREYTDFRDLNYPYICIAISEGKIVGRLYLDPNPNNAILRDLQAAIIDNVVVDPAFEGRGVADKLLEFSENLARQNGIRWLEIGVQRARPGMEINHLRRGTDSARLYVRRGFYHHPRYLTIGLEIHYQARNFPNPGQAGTFIARRYENGLVMYKDLEDRLEISAQTQVAILNALIPGIPR